MNFFPQPYLALPESPKLRAKQAHAKSAPAPRFTFDSHPRESTRKRVPQLRGASRERGILTPSSLNSAPRLRPDRRRGLTPRRLPAAFSLTEVVIAMGVAAVAFTSIIALFPLGLNMSKESYEATQAALIAQTILADVKDQQTGNGNQRAPNAPWNTRLIQIANNSDPINVLTNYATVKIDQLDPQVVYIAYKPFVGTGNDTDTNNPAMLRPSTGIYAAAAPNWYSTGSNGAIMLVKVTFSPTIMLGSATSTSTPRRVDVSVETPGSANISNRTCYLFTGAIRQ